MYGLGYKRSVKVQNKQKYSNKPKMNRKRI